MVALNIKMKWGRLDDWGIPEKPIEKKKHAESNLHA